MKFIILTVAVAAVAAYPDIHIGQDCGDNYGMEVCGSAGVGDADSYVVVCNDMHVWAVRESCSWKYCCKDKPEGGAYCAC